MSSNNQPARGVRSDKNAADGADGDFHSVVDTETLRDDA